MTVFDTLGFEVKNEAAQAAWLANEEREKWKQMIEKRGWKGWLRNTEVEAQEVAGYYDSLKWMSRQKEVLERRDVHVATVHRDIDTALLQMEKKHERRDALIETCRNVLYTTVLRNRNAGYIQGFADVCMLLASVLEEEDCFWIIVCISEMILPAYTSFRSTLSDIATLQWLLCELDPEFSAHLKKIGASVPAFLSSFYVGIFSSILPPETCLLAWGQIFRSCSPDIAIIRTVFGVIVSTRDKLLEATSPKEITEMLFSEASSLCNIDEILSNSKKASRSISDEVIQEKRIQLGTGIERDSAKLQTQRSGIRLSSAGLLTKSVLRKIQKKWTKTLDDEATQHEFLSFMEEVGIDSVENNLSKVYRQWQGGSITYRLVLLGLILLMDGGLADKLRAITEAVQEDGKIPLERYLEVVTSRVWNHEVSALAASSNASFVTSADPEDLAPDGSRKLATSIFSQLHTSHSSQHLTIPEFITAILANPSMYLLLNNPQANPDPSPIWTPDQNPPTWVSDESSENCFLCQNAFKWYRRRHHCRCCGQLMCYECTKERRVIEEMGYSTPVRVCIACSEQLVE
eukprot:TRINITY_DN1222_c0_g1_i3.p1 TRINITY_DN1222_c0_g1~~TRINITY_DN1222_c0_g1_i3.p1  ORF type:complete len:592 (+),score=90.42 TRINITY_DN1222_c0_g1_i3:55-1776(+)